MATYYISAIRKITRNSHTYISEVLLHVVTDSKIKKGEVVPKNYVIELIKDNEDVYTVNWNYTKGQWKKGEPVSYERVGRNEYLRSDPDDTERDNLLHLLPLGNLGH